MKRVFRNAFIMPMAALIIMVNPSLSVPQTHSGLYEAVSKGDAAMVSRLLDEGADVNAGNEMGITPLMEAAGRGDVAIMTLLLNRGADVNVKLKIENLKGMTALMAAVISGNAEAVNILIGKGADVNARYQGRWSTLTMAAAAGQQAIADMLIKNGADSTNLQKDVTEFKETKIGKATYKANLAYLNAALKNAYTAAQAYFLDHPGVTITELGQLEEAGFRMNRDYTVFVRADLTETSGGIVLSSKRLDASNSIAAKGLRAGEGMINFKGDLSLPKLR